MLEFIEKELDSECWNEQPSETHTLFDNGSVVLFAEVRSRFVNFELAAMRDDIEFEHVTYATEAANLDPKLVPAEAIAAAIAWEAAYKGRELA